MSEIVQINRIPVEHFEVALYDGTNAEWIVRTFFDSHRNYLVDPTTQELMFYFRNNFGPLFLNPGHYAKRTSVPETVAYGPQSLASLQNNGGSIYVEPSDFPSPLDDPMS